MYVCIPQTVAEAGTGAATGGRGGGGYQVPVRGGGGGLRYLRQLSNLKPKSSQ